MWWNIVDGWLSGWKELVGVKNQFLADYRLCDLYDMILKCWSSYPSVSNVGEDYCMQVMISKYEHLREMKLGEKIQQASVDIVGFFHLDHVSGRIEDFDFYTMFTDRRKT